MKLPTMVRRICEVPRRKFTSVLRILQIHSVCCTYSNVLKIFIKTMLYNFNNSIVSGLNFNILKQTSLKLLLTRSKFYVFKNYFLKKRSCATAIYFSCSGTLYYLSEIRICFKCKLCYFSIKNVNSVKSKYTCLLGYFYKVVICYFEC